MPAEKITQDTVLKIARDKENQSPGEYRYQGLTHTAGRFVANVAAPDRATGRRATESTRNLAINPLHLWSDGSK